MAKLTTAAAREKNWRERDDARVLADAGEITQDKPRLKRAIAKAKVIAKENEAQIKAMKNVANKKIKIKRTTTKK